jgi:branched-chain amino acid aminotransferase
MILSAFADEIAVDLPTQLAVLRRHDIGHVDIRSVAGRNVLELDDGEAIAVHAALTASGLRVATLATPIGKDSADLDPDVLEAAMARLARLARLLDTSRARVFGFFPPLGGGDWRAASLGALRRAAASARAAGITLLLENEVGTAADTIERTVDLLVRLDDDHVRAAFDPANALRCGAWPCPDGYLALRPWIHQVQVKDIDAHGHLVPAGRGVVGWPALFAALREDGFDGFVSLEPHLTRAGPRGGFTGPTLFGEAHRALISVLNPCPGQSAPGHEGGQIVETSTDSRYSPPSEDDWLRRGWKSTGWPFLASVNGHVGPAEEAVVPCTDEGFLRGDGAFEVLQVYVGRPFALDAHLDRFARTCAAIELDFPRDEILSDLSALLAEAGPVDCLWRVLVARGGTRLHLLEWVPPEKRRSTPVALRTVRYQPTVVLNNLKPMSYGANMAASRQARRQGADEGLFVHPDGTVLEAPTASVFWAKDGVLHTPELGLGILPSITRSVIIDALETREVVASLEELLGADEAFLASTSREIQPIRQVDDVEFDAAPGPLCRAARRALDDAIAVEGVRS